MHEFFLKIIVAIADYLRLNVPLMKTTLLLTPVIASCLLVSNSLAAPIIWAVGDISGNSNISTNGSGLLAYNFGNTTETINGVTFAQATVSTASSITIGGSNEGAIQFSGGQWSQNNASFGGSSSNPYASLSTAYQGFLIGATGAGGDRDVTLLNLDSGQEYEIQFWSNDSRNIASVWTRTNTFTATNSATLDFNVQNAGGGLGQFATGVFTADAASQLINLTSNSDNVQIQGYQIRAIPEPTSIVLLLGALAGLALMRRHRSTQA